MGKPRFAFPLLAVLAIVTAGCGGPGDSSSLSPEERVRESTGIRGTVTDDAFVPVEDAVVTLRTDKRQVRTGADGAYEFLGLEPGNHLVSVAKFGFAPGTFHVQVWATAVAELDIPLKPVPTGEPYYNVFPFGGFITCEAAVGSVPQDTVYTDCGVEAEDLQEDLRRQDVEFEYGAYRVLAELDWEPVTPAAKRLTFAIGDGRETAGSDPFHVVQQGPGARVFLVRGTLNLVFGDDGGIADVTVQAAPAIDEHGCCQTAFDTAQHPPVSAGLAFQQGFDVYSTVFYFSHGAPGFSAIPA